MNLEFVHGDEIDKGRHVSGFEPAFTQLSRQSGFAHAFRPQKQESLPPITGRTIEGVSIVDEGVGRVCGDAGCVSETTVGRRTVGAGGNFVEMSVG